MNANTIRETIKNRIDQSGVYVSTTAKLAGMSPELLRRSLAGSRKFTATELVNLCQLLGLELKDFEEKPVRPTRPATYNNLRSAAREARMTLEEVGGLVGWSEDKLDEFLGLEYDPTMEEAAAIQKAIAPSTPIAVLFRP